MPHGHLAVCLPRRGAAGINLHLASAMLQASSTTLHMLTQRTHTRCKRFGGSSLGCGIFLRYLFLLVPQWFSPVPKDLLRIPMCCSSFLMFCSRSRMLRFSSPMFCSSSPIVPQCFAPVPIVLLQFPMFLLQLSMACSSFP